MDYIRIFVVILRFWACLCNFASKRHEHKIRVIRHKIYGTGTIIPITVIPTMIPQSGQIG